MSPNRLSRLEAAVRTVLAFNEAFNRHDVDMMLQQLSSDCIFEDTTSSPDGKRYTGKESLAEFWEGFFKEFPNARIQIEEIFGLGYRCIMRWRCDWGEPGNEHEHVRGVDIFHVREGLICEKLSYRKC